MTDYTKYKPGDVSVHGLIEECPVCHRPGHILRAIMESPFWAVVLHNTDNPPEIGYQPKPGESNDAYCVVPMNDGRVTGDDYIKGTGPADQQPIGLFRDSEL